MVERFFQVLVGLQSVSNEEKKLDFIHDFQQILQLYSWKNKPDESFTQFMRIPLNPITHSTLSDQSFHFMRSLIPL